MSELHSVVDIRNSETLYSGTMKGCEGYMWDLYMDDMSDEGWYVWCKIY